MARVPVLHVMAHGAVMDHVVELDDAVVPGAQVLRRIGGQRRHHVVVRRVRVEGRRRAIIQVVERWRRLARPFGNLGVADRPLRPRHRVLLDDPRAALVPDPAKAVEVVARRRMVGRQRFLHRVPRAGRRARHLVQRHLGRAELLLGVSEQLGARPRAEMAAGQQQVVELSAAGQRRFIRHGPRYQPFVEPLERAEGTGRRGLEEGRLMARVRRRREPAIDASLEQRDRPVDVPPGLLQPRPGDRSLADGRASVVEKGGNRVEPSGRRAHAVVERGEVADHQGDHGEDRLARPQRRVAPYPVFAGVLGELDLEKPARELRVEVGRGRRGGATRRATGHRNRRVMLAEVRERSAHLAVEAA